MDGPWVACGPPGSALLPPRRRVFALGLRNFEEIKVGSRDVRNGADVAVERQVADVADPNGVEKAQHRAEPVRVEFVPLVPELVGREEWWGVGRGESMAV